MARIWRLFGAAFALALLVVAAPALAQGAPQGDTWASIKQLPDWSGVWQLDPHRNANQTNVPIPFTPVYANEMARVRAITQSTGGDVPSNTKLCRPGGPRMLTPLGVIEFLFTPGQVMIMPESNALRRVYTDGRGHPKNVTLTYYGHSIGHWEGGTLVISTVGLKPDGEFLHGLKTGPAGKDIEIVERIALTSPGHLKDETTMTSPTAFVAPYHDTATFTHIKYRMMEDVCEQNNRDIDPFGHQRFDLKDPPPPPLPPPPVQ